MPNASFAISPIEQIVDTIRAGRMVVVVDDEDRENEGDLIIAAQHVTADAINFMARYGRGLICLAMTQARIDYFGLPLMAQHNRARHQTAFTVSIEARDGISTGISAADRAHTVRTAISPQSLPADLVSPGHVFPLMARDGGVLVRAGHTEAAVDLARLAGLLPAGVICEIMNDDGTMARLPDLIPFAQQHGLPIGTIADLIAWRRRNEVLVERTLTKSFASHHGGVFTMHLYVNRLTGAEHIALTQGDVADGDPVMVRMHTLNIVEDVLHDSTTAYSGGLARAMQRVGEQGRGAIVILREPQPMRLTELFRADSTALTHPAHLREYGVGAQILLDLGVRRMLLLSNTPRTIAGLDGYGLTVERQIEL